MFGIKQLKPAGEHVGKNILKNPGRALQIASQIGKASATRNPAALMNAGNSSRENWSPELLEKELKVGSKILTLTDQYGGLSTIIIKKLFQQIKIF